MPGDVRDQGDSPEVARQRCLDFAATHPEVPMYSRVAEAVADDAWAVDLLRAAAPGQARPVLLLAALHDLVMQRTDEPAARWFPSVSGEPVPDGDPWPDVRATLTAHEQELREVIAHRSTQTNEVNRATYVLALVAAACADLPDTPITLLELGASAGLLLNSDRYRVTVGEQTVGPQDSPVHCVGETRGPQPSLAVPPIAARVGIDAFPIGPHDTDDLRWLRACLWPEVPGRVERFDSAVKVLEEHPPVLVAGDMIDALPAAIDEHRSPGSHLVVFSSWAITYVPRERRPEILAHLAGADGPVSLVTAEPPGCVPGLRDPDGLPADRLTGTDVGLHRWRGGAALEPQVLGRVHPHGAWLDLH